MWDVIAHYREVTVYLEQLAKLELNISVCYFLNKALFGCLFENHSPDNVFQVLSVLQREGVKNVLERANECVLGDFQCDKPIGPVQKVKKIFFWKLNITVKQSRPNIHMAKVW